MSKTRKPNATRTPPIPSDDHSVIDEWIRRRVMPELSPVVREADELICAAIPRLHYAIKWGKVYYGLPDRGWIIELAAYDVSMNIVFFGGADFDDPPPLGETDRSRYVKLKTRAELSAPEVASWIKQAATVPGWK